MKGDSTLILFAVAGIAFFGWKQGWFSKSASASIASGPPAVSPGAGMEWQWNGFSWANVPQGAIAL